MRSRYTRWLALLGVAGLTLSLSARQEKEAEPFRLPDDAVGKLLAKVLPPAPRVGPFSPPAATEPRTATASTPLRLLEPPTFLPEPSREHLRLPRAASKAKAKPVFTLDESLGEDSPVVTVPREPTFETERRVRVDEVDVSIPPAMPLIATPVPDRISLDDATLEASTAAVLSAELPRRTTPAPFVRQTVPEPFEHRREGQTPAPLPEEATTPETPPGAPRP